MQKSLENTNYRTTGICEITVVNRSAFFLEHLKKFSEPKQIKGSLQGLSSCFYVFRVTVWKQKTLTSKHEKAKLIAYQKKTWYNFPTKVHVSKPGQDFYLNKENLALLLTTGKAEMEQVRQPYQPILNQAGASSIATVLM